MRFLSRSLALLLVASLLVQEAFALSYSQPIPTPQRVSQVHLFQDQALTLGLTHWTWSLSIKARIKEIRWILRGRRLQTANDEIAPPVSVLEPSFDENVDPYLLHAFLYDRLRQNLFNSPLRVTQESLSRLAEDCLRADPTGALLRREWVPLFQNTLSHRGNVSLALSALGPRLLDLDPTQNLFNTIWKPLYGEYLDALAKSDAQIKSSEVELAPIGVRLFALDPTGELWKREFFPLFLDPNKNPQHDPAHNPGEWPTILGTMAEAFLQADRTGKLFKERWYPLYNRAHRNLRHGSLAVVAHAVLAADPTGELFDEELLRYSTKALEFETGFHWNNQNPEKSLIGALAHLYRIRSSTEPEFLNRWIPLFKRAAAERSSKDDVIVSLSDLTLVQFMHDRENVSAPLALELLRGIRGYISQPVIAGFLTNLGRGLIRQQASLEEFHRFWLPFYTYWAEKSLHSAQDGALAVHRIALESHREDIAHSIETVHEAAFQSSPLRTVWSAVRLIENWATQDPQSLKPNGKAGILLARILSQEEARSEFLYSYDRLDKVFLAADPTGHQYLEYWLPLRRRLNQSYLLLHSDNEPWDWNEMSGGLDLRFLLHPHRRENDLMKVWSAIDSSGATESSDRTQSWVQGIELMKHSIVDSHTDLQALWAEFIDMARRELLAKGKHFETASIENAYRAYFEQSDLPRSHRSPKDLLAHILFDFALRRWNLPTEISAQVRRLLESPDYMELLPLVQRLEIPAFRESILKASAFAAGLPEKERRLYWSGVFRALALMARDWEGYESLRLMGKVLDILGTLGDPSPAQRRDVRPWLQSVSAQLPKLIVDGIAQLFHLEIEHHLKAPTAKEIHVARYVARQEGFDTRDHLVNQALRAYFKARFEGRTTSEAIARFHAFRASMPWNAEEDESQVSWISELKPYLQPDQSVIRHPSDMEGTVHSSRSSGLQRRQTTWRDVIRHLKELAASTEGSHQAETRSHLNQLPEDVPLAINTMKTQVSLLQEWLMRIGPDLPVSARDLYRVLLNHLQELALLDEESDRSNGGGRQGDQSHLELRLTMAQDPIEILHLGWDRLGGSCLDIVHGSYQRKAAGYLLHRGVGVLFFYPTNRPERAAARVSVLLDPLSKSLIVISPIKSSRDFEFQPLLGRYLRAWADREGLTVVVPNDLGFDQMLGIEFKKGKQDVHFHGGPIGFYTDLDEFTGLSHHSVEGWIYEPNPSKEQGVGSKDNDGGTIPPNVDRSRQLRKIIAGIVMALLVGPRLPAQSLGSALHGSEFPWMTTLVIPLLTLLIWKRSIPFLRSISAPFLRKTLRHRHSIAASA